MKPVRNDKESIRWVYRISRNIYYYSLKIVFRLNFTGLENIPLKGGAIIAPNHASYADPPCVGSCIPREVTFFAKKELFSIPVIKTLITCYNSIPVDRGGYSRGILKEIIHRLKNGWLVLIFPEGTRSKDGNFREPKSGAGMAAVMADVPVIPCWVEGSFRAKPFLSKITVHFLPPFKPSEIEAKTRKEHYLLVSKRIMCDINKLCKTHMAVRN
ncbi:MAG: 1-acyl-sn-glycerol-3-phosphate acyltransferase [Candidatus Latescibacteria bacterium]|nr:1-acyl-sn-glycerol-3-phosphate acyltransferase [Candidatus Latescibacterota bacterium]